MPVFFRVTVLEVMQFARDAHMAEGWMIAQEGYLKSENLGVSRLSLLLYESARRIDENLLDFSTCYLVV